MKILWTINAGLYTVYTMCRPLPPPPLRTHPHPPRPALDLIKIDFLFITFAPPPRALFSRLIDSEEEWRGLGDNIISGRDDTNCNQKNK